MQVNPEDGPPEIYVTWSDPRMTDFENSPISKSRSRLISIGSGDRFFSAHRNCPRICCFIENLSLWICYNDTLLY